MDNKLYDESSIQSLAPREFIRLRPSMYLGSTEYSSQLLLEGAANSIDEANIGHGNKIIIDYKKDEFRVQDFGQGILVNSIRSDGKTILEAVYSVFNTSGKYDDKIYGSVSTGVNGAGGKTICFLSDYLIAKTVRDGQYEKIKFKDGIFQSREVGSTTEPSGVTISWKPSKKFFEHTEVEDNKILDFIHSTVCLTPGLEIVLNGKSYKSEKGLAELLPEGKKIVKNNLVINWASGKEKLDLVMNYTEDYNSIIMPYVNSAETISGNHITQFKTIITREMNKFFREKKWLKEKDNNLNANEIQEGLKLVFSLKVPNVGYDGQLKNKISKIDMTSFCPVFTKELKDWLEKNEKDIKTLADKAINARRANEAAKKARESVRNKNEKKQKALKFDSKLADCYGKTREKCELYICEGDSASGNLKLARDNEFQAVLPVRGKILNCCKATLAQIQKNQEIMTMIDAFGLTIDPKTMKLTYNKKDLRYGKIIIMSDADVSSTACEKLCA